MADEWPLRPLGQLTQNFDSVRVPVKEADRVAGPYPYYGASGIVDHVDKYLFDGEYLLIAEDGENLRTRNTPVAFLARGKFWVNNHAHIVLANDEADTRFLMYALAATDISGYLTGSTMPKLTQGNMNRIPVVAPPLKQQQAIACILGALDDKIELNRAINRTLEATAQAIFKSWFVDFGPVRAKTAGQQPPGLKPEIAALFPAAFEESELGEIPAGWRTSPIGDAVQVLGGGTPSTKEPAYWEEGSHPFCTPKDMSSIADAVLLATERHLTDAGLAKVSSGQLPIGTVLLSSRAPIGYLAIAETPVSINQGIIAMVCDGELPNLYVLHWTRANMDRVLANANGSTFMEISKRNFRPITAIVPPPQALWCFMQVVEPMHRRVVSSLEQIQHLVDLRDSLLPKLVSGELVVAEAERIVGRAI